MSLVLQEIAARDLYGDREIIQRVLRVLGPSRPVVVGGAARDLYHGRAPKDYDIMLLGSAEVDDIIQDLDMVRGSLRMEVFGDGSSMLPVESLYQGADPERLAWVIKVRLDGLDIDIIKYTEDYETAKEAVENFDLSLNMAWIDPSDFTVKLHPEYPIAGGLVTILPRCDDPSKRVEYIRHKYPHYHYPTNAEIQAFLYKRESGH